jgi:uncharacterized protein YgiB involved in biofilm formation
MKRSKAVALTLMGASAILLQACEEDRVDAQIFRDLPGCLAAGDLTEAQCQEVYGSAVQQHAETAPRFANREACVAEFGEEGCQQQQTAAGGSMWMPLMIGFMAGRMLSGGGGYSNTEPLYRSRNDPGNFRTADNNKVPAKYGATKLPGWAAEPAQTRTRAVNRGGFGGSSQAASGGG